MPRSSTPLIMISSTPLEKRTFVSWAGGSATPTIRKAVEI